MLILGRRINECVIINDNITIKVLGVKGNQVRLGFEAPADVVIHREEIFDRIQESSAFVQKKKMPVIAYRNRPLQRPVSHQVLL